MRVVAKRLGYYDLKRRREGDHFELKSEKDFSPSWMEALDPVEEKKPAPKKVVSPKKHEDDSVSDKDVI